MKTTINSMNAGNSMRRRRADQAGFTLMEILISVAITAIVFVATLVIYDQLQASFKESANAASQQQNTRVAFDRLVADLRMAGFNYNPNGDLSRPDEQIEGMWDQAITVRGDFDFEDATAATSPESTLGGVGDPFAVVSTGNDEIVTYALGKPAASGGSSISFTADVAGVPRDGTQETVTISNVHLTQTDPPYTLYRYTVLPNSTGVTRQAVADNIKELEFSYFDAGGDPLTAVGGGEDPNSIAQRDRIARIGIRVVGMTEDPDLDYIDPADANGSTKHYRKFELATDVTPRNIGYVGQVDMDLGPPGPPTNLQACQGHCEGTRLTWDPSPDLDVAGYFVRWGPTLSSMTNVIETTNLNHYATGITSPHYYSVAAKDFTGNTSVDLIIGPSTPTNVTIPAQVTGVACTGDGGGSLPPVENQINVSWSPIGSNATNLSCDVSPYPIRDLDGYQVVKGASASFDPNNPSEIIESWDPNSLPATATSLTDTNVVNCRPYYYRVQGVDDCGLTGAASAAVDGSSTTSIPPAAPIMVDAQQMGPSNNVVTWAPVTQNSDTTPAPIMVDTYAVYRALVNTGDDPNQATYTQVWSGVPPDPANPSFDDSGVPVKTGSEAYYYRISSLDDCPNESALSLPDEADQCDVGMTITMDVSPGGSFVVGVQTITIDGSMANQIKSTQLIIRETSSGTVVFSQKDNQSPYQYTWDASSVPPGGTYQIVGLLTNTSGCTDGVATAVSTLAPVACCIAPVAPDIQPTTGPVKKQNTELFYDIVNDCGRDVEIDSVDISWTNNAGQNAQLNTLEYNIFDVLTTGRLFDPGGGQFSPASFDFTATPGGPLQLLAGNDDLNPVRLKYTFSKSMLNFQGGVYVGEDIVSDFSFRYADNSGFGTCSMTVVTNPLSVVSCDPEFDPDCNV